MRAEGAADVKDHPVSWRRFTCVRHWVLLLIRSAVASRSLDNLYINECDRYNTPG